MSEPEGRVNQTTQALSGAPAPGATTLQPASSVVARYEALFDRVGSVRAVAVLRIVLGPIVVLHLAPFLRDAQDGIHFDDHFWEPYAWFMPKPDGGLWVVVLWLGAGAAVLMSLGVLTRLTAAVTFAVVAGNLLLSQTEFRHNRAFLAIILGGVALLPSGRVLSFDSWWRRARGLPALGDSVLLWPLWLTRVQVSLVYLASGTSKLIDPDWFGGLVLWDRVVRYQHVLDPFPVPDWAVDLLTTRALYYVVAPVAVATELFIGIALWRRGLRIGALWAAVLFHAAIEISASVEVFSYGAVAALAIWVTTSTRDRTVRVGPGSYLAPVVRWGDWFGRFRLEPAGPGAPEVVLVDRDGTVLTGRAATAMVMSRLPLTFLFAAPFLLARRSRPVPVGAR
jgi:uncharacterized membrane protein YphA (DoxX/SURF4 family)